MMRISAQMRIVGGSWRTVGGVIGGYTTTGEHGFLAARVTLDTSNNEALALYASHTPMELMVHCGVWRLFEGDVIGVSPAVGGTVVEARGAWASLGNRPYTEMWQETRLGEWKVLSGRNSSSFRPENYHVQTGQNEIVIGLKDGTSYTTAFSCVVGYFLPEGANQVDEIVFTIDSNMPTAILSAFRTFDHSDGVGGSISVTGGSYVWSANGAVNSTVTQAVSYSGNGVWFQTGRIGAGTTAHSGNSDTARTRLTAIAVKRNSGTSYAGNIIKDIVASFSADDARRIASDVSEVLNGAALRGTVSFEDMDARRVIESLEVRGDDSSLFACSIWDDRRVSFRPRSDYGRLWGISAEGVRLKRDFDGAYTDVVPVYNDAYAQGYRRRGQAQTDVEMVALWGYQRIKNETIQSTDEVEAETIAELTKGDSTSAPKFTIKTRWLQDATGQALPAFYARALDTVQIKGLPIAVANDVGKIRVAETRFDFRTGEMELVPEKRPSSLVQYLARK